MGVEEKLQMRQTTKYPKSVRKQAFRLWKDHDGNFSAVARYEGMPSVPTLIKWAEREDWEGRLDKIKDLVKESLLQSDDPNIKKIVKEDAFMLIIAAALEDFALETIKRRRRKVMPRNTHDMIEMLKFSRELRAAKLPEKNSLDKVDKHSVKKVLEEMLGNDDHAQHIKDAVVVDMRRRLRAIQGGKDAVEDAS